MEDRTLLQRIPRPAKPSTTTLIISKLIVIALPVTQVVMGGVYLNDCPVQRYIPIYLLVSGGFSLALAILSCLPCTQEPEDGSPSTISSICTTWNSLVTLFLSCWFIAGNVWIYSVYEPSYEPGSLRFCAKPLYLFSFWTTTLVYILLGVVLLGGCCVLFCMCVCGRTGLNRDIEDV